MAGLRYDRQHNRLLCQSARHVILGRHEGVDADMKQGGIHEMAAPVIALRPERGYHDGRSFLAKTVRALNSMAVRQSGRVRYDANLAKSTTPIKLSTTTCQSLARPSWWLHQAYWAPRLCCRACRPWCWQMSSHEAPGDFDGM